MAEDAVPLGLAGLVVAASIIECLHKRGVIDQEGMDSIIKSAVVYMQAFCADRPPEIEQETNRILQLVAKASGEAQSMPSE
jgi:hypothetical protein